MTPESDLIEILQRRSWLNYFVKVFGYPPHSKTEASGALPNLSMIDLPRLIGDSPNDLRVAVECEIEFIGRDSGIAPSAPPRLFIVI